MSNEWPHSEFQKIRDEILMMQTKIMVICEENEQLEERVWLNTFKLAKIAEIIHEEPSSVLLTRISAILDYTGPT
jgi:hypothetical protein